MSKIMQLGVTLALVFCILLSTSCGLIVINKNPGVSETDTDGTVTTATDEPASETDVPVPPEVSNDYSELRDSYLAGIPDTKYTDSYFKIVSPDLTSFSEEDSPEYIDKAAAERNRIVEEKHDITLLFSKVDASVLYEEVAAADKAGMYFSDLLLLPQNFIGSFSANDLIINMRSIPGLDFDAEYLFPSSVEAAAGGFYSFGVAGYGTVSPDNLPCVFFNKAFMGDNDLYSLVTSGKWTWDKFFEIAVGAAAHTDVFSWATCGMGESVYDAAFVSCGNKMISSGIMTVPTLGFTAESAASAESVLKELYSTDATIRVNSSAMGYFGAGLGYFYIDHLSAMETLSTSRASWGIVPLPVYAEGDAYRSLAGDDSLFFACPSTVSTPTKSSTILMSLNAASVGTVKDAFILHSQFSYLRDNESANMLDIIINSAVYDFSYTFGNLYTGISDGTYNIIRGTALPDAGLAGLINYYSYSLNAALESRFGLSH